MQFGVVQLEQRHVLGGVAADQLGLVLLAVGGDQVAHLHAAPGDDAIEGRHYPPEFLHLLEAAQVGLHCGQVGPGLGHLLVLAGLVLAIYDIKHREYPLMVWLVFAGLVLALLGFNLPFFLFLLLAILAEIFPLKMGSGDFLYMALIALVFSVTDLLWVIQISSFLGILFAALFQQKSQPIPFIPFLLIGLICYLPLVSFVF